MPDCRESIMGRGFAVVAVFSLLTISSSSSMVWGEEEQPTSCQVLVDWGQDWQWGESGELEPSILHRYRVVFEPEFTNGTSPTSVNSTIQHFRGETEVSEGNYSTFIAGGEVEFILSEKPIFGDSISISISSTYAHCSRTINVTNWNQPISDHEVTRETSWATLGIEDEIQGISFDGRGWQKRTGSILQSSELGNGSLSINLTENSQGAVADLELDRIWLNESYDGMELISQDFEMKGFGELSISIDEGSEGAVVDASISDAYILRSFTDGKISERMRFDGNGWISINGGDNESSEGVFGEVFKLYFETWDDDGFRRLQDLQIEANASARISGPGEAFSFELDDLILNEKWEEGVRTNHLYRIFGSGEFDFIASESPYIVMNGTIPLIHIQSEGGETVSDTTIVDGTYSGDVEGTFGLVRQIVESGIFDNHTGVPFEADKIRNEFWLNVSALPFGPIDQEFGAEHNLTYEYVVPQEDWLNRTIRYTYVEDNGTVEEEFPENSPIINNAEAPESRAIFSDHISRETGACPQILATGDSFSLLGNMEMILEVSVDGFRSEIIDGHLVSVSEWFGVYDDNSAANGTIINEGPLSGLLNEVSRTVKIGFGSNDQVSFVENQRVDRILYPPIVTFDENTPPTLSEGVDSSVRFREGILTNEGGTAHLEVLIYDHDTDTRSVVADLSSIGLGMVELSDSGLYGDQVIHDDIWTTRVSHDGLEFGNFPITITMQDYWVTVEEESTIMISNAPPRMLELEFSPDSSYRAETVNLSILAFDGHGLRSVSVDLQGFGGGLIYLQRGEDIIWNWDQEGISITSTVEAWYGSFSIPPSISPGRQSIPIILEDNEGGSVSTHFLAGISPGSQSRMAEKLTIGNLPPSVSNLSIMVGGFESEHVVSPISGAPIEHTLEVSVSDYDGISSVQAKIGRLAPIGQSEDWILMFDDGVGADRHSNDGIFSLSFSARQSLSEGEMSIMIRATDVFQSITEEGDQIRYVSIEKSQQSSSGPSWFAENTTELLLASISILLLIGVGSLFHIIRNSELE